MSYKINLNTNKVNYTYNDNIILKESITIPSIRNRSDFNIHYLNIKTDLKNQNEEYYKQAIDYYVNKQESNQYEVIMDTIITLNTNDKVSLYYEIYSYLGGAHGDTVRIGNTWDMNTNKLMTLSEIIKKENMNKLFDIIKKEAYKRQEGGKIAYFDDLDKNIEELFDPENFYLDQNGINIFYPLYTIGPYYIGIQVFHIDYKDLY